MKKIILVVLCAITCIATFTACNQTKSGNRIKSETTEVDTAAVIQSPSSQIVDSVKKQKSGSFTPVEIQVTEPVENKNADIGEGIQGYEYTATIFFIDSVGTEYSIELYSSVRSIEVGKKETEQWHKDDLKELDDTKKLFTLLTSSAPSSFYITYGSPEYKLFIYKKEKTTDKKIGVAKVRESDPEPVWVGRYEQRSVDISNRVTNASNSNE